MMSVDFSRRRRSGGLGHRAGQLRPLHAGGLARGDQLPPAHRALQVACENGIAFVDLPASLVWFDQAGRHHETLESERPLGEALLLQFYRNVTSLVLQSSSLEDAYKALAVVLAARSSHAQGQPRPFQKLTHSDRLSRPDSRPAQGSGVG